jgi:dethiobiotin synthetase
MSLFITGTGTGVGKTVVTAALAAWLKSRGENFCVYKPLQTGSPDPAFPEDPITIQSWVGSDVEVACSYCFPQPLAPYAADPGRTIQSGKILQDFKALQKKHRIVLVEGAGGVRVPVAQHLEMIDLIRMLQLPVVVVAHPHLGTMNHILLTVESLLARGIEVKGVVLSNFPKPEALQDLAIQTLIHTLEPFLKVPLLGTLSPITLSPTGFMAALPEVEALGLFD